jgi:hypothetical protein
MAQPRSHTPFPLLLSQAPLLLQEPYSSTETGYALNSEGMHHIAASTYMPNCNSAMISWWFGWIHTTSQYKLWHPLDHIYSSWEGPRENNSNYIGGHHLVHEYIGGPLSKLKISFVDPGVYFGENWEEEFKMEGYELAVCGRVGAWNGEEGGTREVLYNGHLIHLVKKEKLGVRMRSRFWLGDVEGVEDPEVRKSLVPAGLPAGLCQHACEEMTILAGVLPGLYDKYSGNKSWKEEVRL